ncbi:hypothetical protein AAFF_G00059200 [Aldrovandia affinis]|uniref:C-type lectin domain-containing protein n=1 Tax=Aldrovandia affinis TaxID=143900 RepID=A0AAD7VX42_9TELE|nr:hypothetical protein AAFF_G00059200 [Aldrovandia affinis]
MSEGVLYADVNFKNKFRREPAVTQREDVTYSEVKTTNSASPNTVSCSAPADHDVYSTVDQTSHNSPGAQPSDQDVYSTVGQTSPNSPGAQHTERRGQSLHPYRLAAVCPWLLCALFLTSTIVLGVLYTSASQNYSVLEIRANKSNMSKDKDQLQRDFDAVVLKFPFLKRVCKPCPEGWEQRNSKCYYFSNERKSWKDSRSACLKQGADLVIIESKEEQEFISKHTGRYYYWIGLSDSETEGTWLWVDGTPLQEDKA